MTRSSMSCDTLMPDRIRVYARDIRPGDLLSPGVHQWLALSIGEPKTINNSVIIVWLRSNMGDILERERVDA